MERTDIDPRYFGEHLGYNHAVLLENPTRWLMLSGHEARDDQGNIAHAGDIAGQLELTVQRLEETLAKADLALSDVVQIRIFTTDLQAMLKNYDVLLTALAQKDCRPTSTLVEVSALSDPAMLVEIEGLAAR